MGCTLDNLLSLIPNQDSAGCPWGSETPATPFAALGFAPQLGPSPAMMLSASTLPLPRFLGLLFLLSFLTPDDFSPLFSKLLRDKTVS